MEFHLKTSKRKAEQKCRKVLHKKPKLQFCLKGGKISGCAPKARQITHILYGKWQRSL